VTKTKCKLRTGAQPTEKEVELNFKSSSCS